MSKLSAAMAQLADLRLRAAQRLNRSASPRDGGAKGLDALAVLHELASSPATAAEALALLHELQVYQVELELQAEELRDARLELEGELQRLQLRYEHQPLACFSLDAQLVVHELNLRAARLLGIGREASYGLLLEAYLLPPGGQALRALMSTLAERQARDQALGLQSERASNAPALTLTIRPAQGEVQRRLRAYLSLLPDEPLFLLTVCELCAPAGEAAEA